MAADRQRGYSEVQIGEVKEEESDDFIIIDVDQCKQQQETPKETGGKTKTAEISSVDSGLDIDDYVEVSYNDVEQEDSKRSEDQKRSLYGVRLFQYSPESEGNIYITNEEL